jgi:hypothetical protein
MPRRIEFGGYAVRDVPDTSPTLCVRGKLCAGQVTPLPLPLLLLLLLSTTHCILQKISLHLRFEFQEQLTITYEPQYFTRF